jgi:hypothetical protein
MSTADLFGNESAVGLTVKLDSDIDRVNSCHANTAIIFPGKAQHAGEFRCAACGAHRGWLSHHTRDFILQTVRRFGAPPTPIVVRQSMEKEVSKFEQKDNTGALFKNPDKTSEKHPDYRGSITVNGVEMWLSAWIKTSAKGVKYMSLALQPKAGDTFKKTASASADVGDRIPF